MTPAKGIKTPLKRRTIGSNGAKEQGQYINTPEANIVDNAMIDRSSKGNSKKELKQGKSTDSPVKDSKPPKPRGTKRASKVIVKEEPPEQETLGVLVPIESHERPAKRSKIETRLPEFMPVDPVMEQWYADPYNRYDPEGPAGSEARKHVLNTALRNRGFRGGRILNIVNWLVRCNGRYKDYDDMVGTNRRRNTNGVQGRHSRTKHTLGTPDGKTGDKETPLGDVPPIRLDSRQSQDKETDKDSGYGALNEDLSAFPPLTDGQIESIDTTGIHRLSTIVEELDEGADETTHPLYNLDIESANYTIHGVDTDTDSNASSSTTLDEEQAAAIQALNQELKSTRSTFQSTHAPGSQAHQDARDDWLLERLERTQAFWNIIYGDDLDDAEPAAVPDPKVETPTQLCEEKDKDVEFTYFRDAEAVPRVDVQYRSQGLNPVKKVMHHGREVLTEDETFGLCRSE